LSIFNGETIGASRAISLHEERKETTMETLMSVAMVIYATILAFLLALWVAWMSLRGLFRMLPARRLAAVPIQAAPRGTGTIGRHAA
jgi:hypothetical protein